MITNQPIKVRPWVQYLNGLVGWLSQQHATLNASSKA